MQYIAFLAHPSRAGSTLLANLLAKCSSGIQIVPELLTTSHIMALGDEKIRSLSYEDWLNVLRLDYQLAQYDIQHENLAEKLVMAASSGGLSGTLISLAGAFTLDNNNTPSVSIFKRGEVLSYEAFGLADIPNAHIIGVVRDPRAVVASSLRNYQPYNSSQMMGFGDPILISQRWRQFVTQLSHREQKNPGKTCIVRYEDLCTNPKAVVSNVLSALGLADAQVVLGEGTPNYLIASAEENIHKKVYNPPDVERTLAWKIELAEEHGLVVETLCKDWMSNFKYNLHFLLRTTQQARLAALRRAKWQHRVTTVKRRLKDVKLLIQSPGLVKTRLVRYWARRRNSKC